MAKINESNIDTKYVTHNNDFYVIWWNAADKLLSKGITTVKGGNKLFPGQAQAITIYADTTEQGCQDKIDELGLT